MCVCVCVCVRVMQTHHITLMYCRVHGELNHEPGSVPQDEGCDQIPMNDVPQAADTPIGGNTGKGAIAGHSYWWKRLRK